VLAAADPLTAGTDPGQATTTVSRRSLLADNANLHEHPRRLQRRINDLEARLSESADNRDQPPMITSSAYG